MQTTNTLSGLSSTQQQRYYSLISTYGDKQARQIVVGLTNRGKNSYAAFIDKMEEVQKAKHDEQDYYTSLYEAFELNTFVSLGDVIRGVGDVRRTLELESYKTKLKIRSEADFFRIFIFEEVYESDGKVEGNERTLIGYVPIAKVRPEEDVE